MVKIRSAISMTDCMPGRYTLALYSPTGYVCLRPVSLWTRLLTNLCLLNYAWRYKTPTGLSTTTKTPNVVSLDARYIIV